MSRNYELLRKAEKDVHTFQDFPKPERPESLNGNGNGQRGKVKTPQQNEITILVHRVFALPSMPGPRMVIFTGVGDGTGSAGVCASVARVLAAQALGTVCVVDANLRSPTLHEHFNVENDCGFADAILHPGKISALACHVEATNLWVLTSGSQSCRLKSLLAADRVAARMKELRESFDYVLINTPGADKSADASVLGRLADGAILVVEANSALREVVQKTKQSLDASGVRLLGAVLNNRRYPIPQALYDRLG